MKQDTINNEILESSTEDTFDITRIFRLILMQSKLVLSIIAIFTSLAIAYYLNVERVYKVSSMVQILPKDNPYSGSNVMQGDFLLGGSSTSSVESIERLYKSRSHILNVVTGLSLNAEFYGLTRDELSFVKKFDINSSFFGDEGELNLKIYLNNESYEIKDMYDETIAEGLYGTELNNDAASIFLIKPNASFLNNNYEIIVTNKESSYKNLYKNIEIDYPPSPYRNLFNSGAILEISVKTSNVSEGIKLLNYSNEAFIQNSIENDSKQARQALEYIDSRVLGLQRELDQKKYELSLFREENKSLDVDLEIESIISSLGDIETKLYETELKIEESRINFTESNPLFLNLLTQRQTLLNQKNVIEREIENLPIAQQEFIDRFKEVEISQNIYNQLMEKKLEFSLKEASTLGNMRVVDEAYLDEKVSPTITMILLAFLFSSLMAVVTAVIRGLLFIPISNPAELPDNNIYSPILGVINKVFVDDDNYEENERFSQAIESLIINIQSKIKEKTGKTESGIIVVTSPTASNGKSFVSRHAAIRLASLGKRVMLMDSDYKRGDQHKSLGLSKIDKETFFNINEQNISEYKTKYENLYAIPRITKINSSFEFLYDEKFSSQMNWLKSNFDYIVIDTAPILSVSDTLILLSYSDIGMLILRHGASRISEAKQSILSFNQIGESVDGIVYNSYEKPSSYYGYYGLYGNYSYQYYAKRYLYQNYDYENDKT